MPTLRLTRLAAAASVTVAILFTTLGLPIAAGPQREQAKTPAPTFEVASITRTPPIGNTGAIAIRLGELQGNRWIAEGITLLMLIRSAYAPQYQMQGQIVGGPSWLQSDRFNVNARAEGMPTAEQARLMLQRLLADRFKLVGRRERRELPVYALVLARSDGKLGRDLKPTDLDCQALRDTQKREASSAPSPAFTFKPGDAPPPCSPMMMMSPTTMRIQSGGSSIAEIASMLSQQAGRPVIDRTGLSGYYTINVEFAREPGTGSPLGGPLPPDALAAGGAATPSDVPSIFAAVQDQLGLKLEPRRDAADVLVIERAEPPTED